MITTELRQLEGKTVLVRSTADSHNPPVGKNGTIHILDTGENGAARLEVVLEFPDMFSGPAHRRAIILEGAEIEKLLSTERAGVYELKVDTPIDQTT